MSSADTLSTPASPTMAEPPSDSAPTSPQSPQATEEEKMLKKRGYVIAEIIDTEKAYLDRLLAVFDIFIEPLRRMNIVDAGNRLSFCYSGFICNFA